MKTEEVVLGDPCSRKPCMCTVSVSPLLSEKGFKLRVDGKGRRHHQKNELYSARVKVRTIM